VSAPLRRPYYATLLARQRASGFLITTCTAAGWASIRPVAPLASRQAALAGRRRTASCRPRGQTCPSAPLRRLYHAVPRVRRRHLLSLTRNGPRPCSPAPRRSTYPVCRPRGCRHARPPRCTARSMPYRVLGGGVKLPRGWACSPVLMRCAYSRATPFAMRRVTAMSPPRARQGQTCAGPPRRAACIVPYRMLGGGTSTAVAPAAARARSPAPLRYPLVHAAC